MEEIEKKINVIVTLSTCSIVCSAIALLLSIRGLDSRIQRDMSTETSVEKLLDDYQKLKIENAILLDKIHSYEKK